VLRRVRVGGERAQDGVARVLEPLVGQLFVEQPHDRFRVVLRDRDP